MLYTYILYKTKVTTMQKNNRRNTIYLRHYSTGCFPFRLILVSRLLLYYHPQLNQRRILTNLCRRLSKLVSHENLEFVAPFLVQKRVLFVQYKTFINIEIVEERYNNIDPFKAIGSQKL